MGSHKAPILARHTRGLAAKCEQCCKCNLKPSVLVGSVPRILHDANFHRLINRHSNRLSCLLIDEARRKISSPPRIGSRGGPPRGKAKTKPSAKESEAATRTFQSQCDSADFLANLLVRKIALFQRQLPTHLQHLDLAGDGVEFHQADRTLV